ncbi:MAG: DUF1858 domain-containing protein [Clostridiales bacterium]|jgi:hybrid cluster-associated redox disulfide protein|nr:DUF1858 domain-containing protein [Clostridiales bacterium]
MEKVTKDMIIAEVLEMDRETAPILFEHGLHCLGCPSATGESLEEACMIHEIDIDAMLKDVNEFLETKAKAEKAE